jgi:hypothetical protein
MNFTKYFLVSFSFYVISCGKKSESGSALIISTLEPTVAQVIPTGMKANAALNLNEESCSESSTETCSDAAKIQILKSRIFLGREGCMASAPADIEGRTRCLLNAIDNRMSELNKQQTDKARRCPEEPLQELAFGLGNLVNFRQKFNCGQSLQGPLPEDKLYLSFGTSGQDFYLQETLSGGRSLYASSNISSKITEIFTFETKKISSLATDDSASIVKGTSANNGKYAMALTHVIAKPSENSFEISVGSNHLFGKGVGCGIQLKSNGTNIYTKGIFADPSRELGLNCADLQAESSSPRHLELCLDAKTLLASDPAQCNSLKSFTVVKIRPADLTQDFYSRVTSTEHVDKIMGFSVFK